MLVVLLLVGMLWELLLYGWPAVWRRRRSTVGPAVVLVSFATAGLTLQLWNMWTVLFVLCGLFRLINLLRIAEGRMHERYLWRATRRTGLLLAGVQVLALGAARYVSLDDKVLLSGVVAVQLLAAVTIALVTIRNIIKTKHQPLLEHYADKELPTVTVAIPARNETADLEDCLRSILANNYPKFEVLVLDDCSHDKTPEIIRSFAQEGVRFLQCGEPEPRWLAKNQAYGRLADAATGELILFCGVDVRFGPETIRALVTTMLNRKKDMVSILPRRLSSNAFAAFIQPMRYWWELALPRRYFNRPPVLSTCWLIRRKKLKKLGGFEAVSHAIIPEGYFARELVKTDGYSFIRADDVLDVQTRKTLADQRETAIRMRYPQVRRRPEWVLLLTLGNLLLLLGPFALLLMTPWTGWHVSQTVAATAAFLLVLTHVLIVQVSNPANTLIAVVNFPAAALTELFLGCTSMFKYEFSTIDWKGRNICIPVMHVIPKLPDTNDSTR